MARDRTKNAYYTVGIPLGSETLRALGADSEETGVSISQLIAVRIADWYRCGRETRQVDPVHPLPVSESGIASAGSYEQLGANGNGLHMRASAAAAAWGSDEDE
jgi:hypothetical protein